MNYHYHDGKLFKIEFKQGKKPRKLLTGIKWSEVIEIISESKIVDVKAVRFHHPKNPKGTEHISGQDVLELWKKSKS
jgi:hypothetical protein